jgi:hypothetical protein
MSPTKGGEDPEMNSKETAPRIALELSTDGVRRLTIGADSNEAQAAAHLFLARLAPELRKLSEAAVKAGTDEQVVTTPPTDGNSIRSKNARETKDSRTR